MEALIAAQDMEPDTQSVARDDADAIPIARQQAAICQLAEARIARHDRRVRAQRAAVTHVLFRAVVPRTPAHGLANPRAS